MRQQHAELCAPVTYVVLSDNSMTQTGEDAGKCITDNGRSQVTHMHYQGLSNNAWWLAGGLGEHHGEVAGVVPVSSGALSIMIRQRMPRSLRYVRRLWLRRIIV